MQRLFDIRCLASHLDGLSRLIEAHSRADAETTARALTAARSEALPLVAATTDDATARIAVESFAGAALAKLVVGHGVADAISAPALLLERIERLTHVPALAVALRTVGDVSLLALPVPATIDAGMRLLIALAPLHEARLLIDDQLDDPRFAADPSWEIADVNGWHRRCAAIVWRPEEGGEAACRAIAERCAGILGPALERASLVGENIERSAAIEEPAERRLTRLGFDIHDGPLQDVALLAGELDGLRRRLLALLPDDQDSAAVLARVEDIDAIVRFLDTDLRTLASTMDRPRMLRKPFDEAIGEVVRSFAVRAGVEPEVTVTGHPELISDSQRIALLRIIQESLSNVREHSGASAVSISVAAHSTHMEATIRDNGAGFDVDDALRAAAQRGRMGLLGMSERVRLLGGTCEIASRPGGGTTISLTIARWVPITAETDPAAAAA